MWQSKEIREAVTGTLLGAEFEATSVTIDSRKLTQGALFVPLKGTRADGHDYVAEALAKGAAGALVHRVPEGLKKNAPLIVVNDTYKALVDLAAAARKRTRARIIAVTGSVGKTGTKEAIRIAGGNAGKVYATQGNLNNHIGLPLSLASLPQDARFGVFELGMNHAGELSFLSRIVRPDIAVITNVEAVHLEFFPNIEGIADAKAEIMEGMQKEGTLVLNRDNAFYHHLLSKAVNHGIRRIVTFGAHEEADFRLLNYRLRDAGSQVDAVIRGTPITYPLGTTGRHWALTSLAALAAITEAGADLANAAAALAHFYEPEGRGKRIRVSLRQGEVTVIDDCYNASPSSVNAALAKLAELHNGAEAKGGRTIAVLGDMLELGTQAADLHKGLLAALTQYRIDKVYSAGPLMKQLYDSLPAAMQGAHVSASPELAGQVLQALKAGDVVLIKGSRGSRMDVVRDALLTSAHNDKKERANAV